MISVNYPVQVPYREIAGAGLQPALLVPLIRNKAAARALAILDTGSSITVFNLEVAEFLGIDDLTCGERATARTHGGLVDFFLFDLEMEVQLPGHGSDRFPARVGFLASHRARNILGRNILFARYQIGFRESRQMILLRPEH